MVPKPSAPLLVDLLANEDVSYGCEYGCDVEFLVGRPDNGQMRIPAHSSKLNEYPVFRAMLSDNFNRNKNATRQYGGLKLRQICIEEVDGKAFDNLMKFIYGKSVNMQTPEMTIETLTAAHTYLIPELVRLCVFNLDKMISLANVLYIYAHVLHLCNDLENLEERTKIGCQPMPQERRNRKPACNSQDHSLAGLETKNLCVWLLCQCLAFIDVHASKVLELGDIEELSGSHLRFLLKRNSLDVRESAVFSALFRWAETECKRQHMPLTSESKRMVLGDLIYLVRYFCMASGEFLCGPGDSQLLLPEEADVINNMIVHGRPFFTSYKRLSHCGGGKVQCHSVHFFETSPELRGVRTYWNYMSRPRNPRIEDGEVSGEKKNKRRLSSKDNGGRRRSFKLRRLSSVIKSICLPCAQRSSCGTDHAEHVIVDKNKSSPRRKSSGGSEGSLRRRESTASKVFDYSLRVFAFFFD